MVKEIKTLFKKRKKAENKLPRLQRMVYDIESKLDKLDLPLELRKMILNRDPKAEAEVTKHCRKIKVLKHQLYKVYRLIEKEKSRWVVPK